LDHGFISTGSARLRQLGLFEVTMTRTAPPFGR
jgi:hypothetical protein